MRLFALLALLSLMFACDGAPASKVVNPPTPKDSSATKPASNSASRAAPRIEPKNSLSRLPEEFRPLFRADGDFLPMPMVGQGDWLSDHPEPGQNYREFVRSRPNKATETRHTIYLQPIGKFDDPALPSFDLLAEYASRFFGMPVQILPTRKDLLVTSRIELFSERRQLLTGSILTFLKWRMPPDAYALIAITDIDIFPSANWEFIFGQASFKDRVGVYSFARHLPSFDEDDDTPLAEAKEFVLRQSLTVMTHELGHMFGIRHCVHFSCLMNGFNALDEADNLSMHVCPVELRKLYRSVRFDPRERYRKLAEFYRRVGFDEEANWAERRAEKGAVTAIAKVSVPAQ